MHYSYNNQIVLDEASQEDVIKKISNTTHCPWKTQALNYLETYGMV